MSVPPIGKEVAAEYTKRSKNEPNRLIFQAADSLLLIVEAIKQAKSTDPKAVTSALQSIKFSGVRGPFTFGKEQGIGYQQWVDIPYVTFQLTDVNQPVSKSNLVQGAGEALVVNKLQRAK
jgi:ABC-type branched-subunit amino acid transport system substrate-binding protein